MAFYPMKPDEGERLDEDEHEETRKSVKSELARHLHDAKSNYAGTFGGGFENRCIAGSGYTLDTRETLLWKRVSKATTSY